MTSRKPTASELAAQRLGYGLDPYDEIDALVEELLSREEWTGEDMSAARATIAKAKKLGPRPAPEPEEPEPRRSASQLAADSLSQQARSAQRQSRGWNR